MRGLPTSIRHRLVLAFAAVLLAALLQGGIGLWSTSRLAAARALAALARSNEAEATRFAEGASTLRRLAQWATAAAIAITLMAAGVLAWPVVRRFVRMLKQAQDTTQPLSAGSLSVRAVRCAATTSWPRSCTTCTAWPTDGMHGWPT